MIKETIQELYKFAPQLLGAGIDNCFEYIKPLIGLDIIEIKSGTQLETWTVPDEWIAKEAWVKDPSGNKIIEYKNDLSLMVYSSPFKGKVDREELKRHLFINKDLPDATPYQFSFYEKKWGFCLPANKVFKTEVNTTETKQVDVLPEGEYEVFIDTEFKPGIMKLGVHTVPGKIDREILLFAHLDHPYQANDNLSGVVCLLDLALRLKDKYQHTIKIIFCPETIGSIGYALTQDISKVDFMIAVDICGSDTQPTVQWSFDPQNRLNRIAHLAMMMGDESFAMNRFRAYLGSDEYVFNDPQIGIPGLMYTRAPYQEYHTSADTPDIILEDKIVACQQFIENVITIYENDFIPVRKFKGPLFRTKFGIQSPVKGINAQMDYLFYNIDGKRYLSEIVDACEMNWRFSYDTMQKLIAENLIEKKIGNSRTPRSKKKK